MINRSQNWIIEIVIRHFYSLDDSLTLAETALVRNDRVNDLGRYKWRLELEVD